MKCKVNNLHQNSFLSPQLGNLLNEVLNTSINELKNKSQSAMIKKAHMNILEKENGYQIDLAIPGFSKKDIDITINENHLIVKGTVTKTKEEKKYNLREFRLSDIERSIRLPKTIDTSSIEASFANGLLTIKLVKKPEAQTVTIDIK